MSTSDDEIDARSRDVPNDTPEEAAAPATTVPPIVRRRHGFFRRHWIIVTLLTLIIVPVAGIFLWATSTLAYSFSDGTRAGYNQKLSRRGWICKTWEGELAMTTSPGTAPQIFRYSVRVDSVARAIEALEGQQVSLHYEQHKGVPTSCFGETEYYVTSVRKIGP
jgi:hypothetical protein